MDAASLGSQPNVDGWAPLLSYDNYMDPERTVMVMGWLSQVSPDDWHLCVEYWNWDNGSMPIAWIIRQPSCDKASAIKAFWLNDPSDVFCNWETYLHYHAPEKRNDTRVTFCTEVLARWKQGFYTRSELALEPDPHFPPAYRETTATFPRQDLVWAVPEEFFSRLSGRTLNRKPPFNILPP